MPDFERIMREFELYMAVNKEQRDLIKAFHKGQDKARKEILYVILILTILFLIGFYFVC